MRKSCLWAVTAAIVGLAACAGDAQDGAAQAEAPAPSASAQTLPIPGVGAATENPGGTAGPVLTWDKPATWKVVQPSSNLRLAQYEVPGSGGTGECVVFYFGPGQGGDPMANAQRWAGQFTQADGSSSEDKLKIQVLEDGNLGLRLVEVTGTYDGGMSMGAAPPTPKPGWMLLGGIADGPDAPWFFKFTGPQSTLEENRDAFVGLLRSVRQEI